MFMSRHARQAAEVAFNRAAKLAHSQGETRPKGAKKQDKYRRFSFTAKGPTFKMPTKG